jgi:hypothetical protein
MSADVYITDAAVLLWRNEAFRLESVVADLVAALERLLVEAGQGSRKGRAIDLLDRQTVDQARAAIARVRGE